MRGTRSFIIKAKSPLVELLEKVDEFFRYLADDVIITAKISDRHGLEYSKIVDQIKQAYMVSVRKNIQQVDLVLGFDYYWTCEPYGGRVITLAEVLQRAELVNANTSNKELNYLVQTNIQSDD